MSIVRSDDLGPAVFGCAQAGCRVCQDHLVRQHEGLVHFVLRRQVHDDVAYAKVLQAGRIGLWQAVLHFDAKRGVAFSTYAVVAIQRRMWQAVVQAQPPRQHRVFVHALRQRRRPYPLPLTDTRQRLRHHLLRLLQPIQKRAEAVAGMTPTRLTLPVLNRTVFAQMPIRHQRGAGRVNMCWHPPTDRDSPLARHAGHSSGVPGPAGERARRSRRASTGARPAHEQDRPDLMKPPDPQDNPEAAEDVPPPFGRAHERDSGVEGQAQRQQV